MTKGGPSTNIGAHQSGSGSMIVGSAIGQQLFPVPMAAPASGEGRTHRPYAADIGIIAMLVEEMREVVRVLQRADDYRSWRLDSGATVHGAICPVPSGILRAVALQTLEQGVRSAAIAYRELRDHFRTPVVLLVGIAGGISPRVSIGDVVVSDEVIAYDARRESVVGVHRRGRSYPVAAGLRHRLNDFFQTHGSVITLAGECAFTMHRGPIGSGDAVITDRESSTRRWLSDVHEKTLAVETEAAGIAQAFYEEVTTDARLGGWLTIRGISDAADAAKGQEHHQLAAHHAALALELLLPFLAPSPDG